MRRWLGSIGGLLSAAGLAWAADPSNTHSQDVSPRALALVAETVDTTTRANLLTAPPASFSESTHYVLQLDGPMTPARHEALEAAGVRLSDYLPSNAYVVELADVNPALLAALPFAAWLGEYESAWKLSPELGLREHFTDLRRQMTQDGQIAVDVTMFEGADVDAAIAAIGAIPESVVYPDTIAILAGNPMMTLTLPLASVAALAQIDQVQFVEESPEITLRNSTTKWILQSNSSGSVPVWDQGLHGENQIVGVIDGKININHCSFSDPEGDPPGPNHRKIAAYNTTTGSDLHGTHVGGTAAGDNGANDNTRGMAYMARICYHTIPSFSETAIYSRLQTHHNQGARSHTNSWGNDGTVAYDSLCRGFDDFLYDFEDSFVCLAVTNLTTLKNPENAKNLLAVGACQDTPNQANHCSGGAGPTNDGRRKPEIYAPGCNTSSAYNATSCSTTSLTGTSMASPAIGGMALLARQYYMDGFYPSGAANGADGFTPTGALLKATLVNAAVDMTGVSGYPSNSEGWGRLLLNNSLYFSGETRVLLAEDVRNADGMSTGGMFELPFEVTSTSEQLRVTLVWTEPAATAGANPAYINNLDLEVVNPSATLYKGNVFSGGVSTTGGTADAKNNVEQVHLNSPPVGQWIARVKGTAVNQGSQGYSLVVTGAVQAASTACFGDLDGNETIDLDDLSIMLTNFGMTSGATYEQGDLDEDGDVDLDDLSALLVIFGTNC